MYYDLSRLFCLHQLGQNSKGQLRVLCYQCGRESETGRGPPGLSDNWRCIAAEKLTGVELLDGLWQSGPNHPGLHPALSILISMPRIVRHVIHRKDSAETARAGSR
jgi:hypothetical protein